MKLFILILLTSLNVLATDAEPGTTTAAKEEITPVAPASNWKADFNSYYYNFEGTQASTQAPYTFGETTLNMQLLTVKYQLSPNWTFMAIAQHLDNYVVTKMFGMEFQDRTRGLGDTYLLAMRPVYIDGSFFVFVDGGVSLPTGSINEKNKYNPAGNYAYNMQLGSGTLDPMLAVMPMYLLPKYQLGARFSTIVRSGENANGYRLGNLYRADAWADYPMGYGLTPRLVGYYKHKDSIKGEDSTLPRQPLTEFYYHAQINWDVSAALKYSHEFSKSLTVGAEVGVPVAQGMSNYDNAVVSTEYYGSLNVSGAY